MLYTGGTRSGCGSAQAAMGPFYCPLDKKVYLDTGFFKEMASKFGVKGDFAYAYVIAHEVGHHVQDVLGILGKVQARQQQASSKTEANALSVRIELMADCLAGVWAKNSNDKYAELDQGDIDEALNAAAQIGDDALQQRPGLRGAGFLHPRLLGPAPALVHRRLQERPDQVLRHVPHGE